MSIKFSKSICKRRSQLMDHRLNYGPSIGFRRPIMHVTRPDLVSNIKGHNSSYPFPPSKSFIIPFQNHFLHVFPSFITIHYTPIFHITPNSEFFQFTKLSLLKFSCFSIVFRPLINVRARMLLSKVHLTTK